MTSGSSHNTQPSIRTRLPLNLPPPKNSMGPRSQTPADHAAVRSAFVTAYDALLEQKDVVLTSDDVKERHDAARRVLECIVSPPFRLLPYAVSYESRSRT